MNRIVVPGGRAGKKTNSKTKAKKKTILNLIMLCQLIHVENKNKASNQPPTALTKRS
jgi:hypothetical protein